MKKKIVVTLLLLVLLTTVGFSVEKYQEIGVFFGSVNKIFINSVDKTTEFKEPFIYNGTTYVSLRDVSEALGQTVFWDDKTKSIYIGERPIVLTIDEIDLMTKGITYTNNIHLYRINNNAVPYRNLDNDAGFTYEPDYNMRIMLDPNTFVTTSFEKGISLKLYDDYSSIYYSLNGEFDVFKGMVGFDYILNNGSYVDYDVNVVVDNKIKQTIHLTPDNVYENFEVAVTEGVELKIEFIRPDSQEVEPFINIVNPVLERHNYN